MLVLQQNTVLFDVLEQTGPGYPGLTDCYTSIVVVLEATGMKSSLAHSNITLGLDVHLQSHYLAHLESG